MINKIKEFVNKNNWKIKIFLIVFAGCLASFAIGRYNAPAEVVVEETVKYVEVLSEDVFNTSLLEKWDGDFSCGEIRMIGAWAYGYDTNGNPIVMDEEKELWTLVGYEVGADEFLLLWIADSGTASVHDDLVMKVWTEKFEIIESVESVG